MSITKLSEENINEKLKQANYFFQNKNYIEAMALYLKLALLPSDSINIESVMLNISLLRPRILKISQKDSITEIDNCVSFVENVNSLNEKQTGLVISYSKESAGLHVKVETPESKTDSVLSVYKCTSFHDCIYVVVKNPKNIVIMHDNSFHSLFFSFLYRLIWGAELKFISNNIIENRDWISNACKYMDSFDSKYPLPDLISLCEINRNIVNSNNKINLNLIKKNSIDNHLCRIDENSNVLFNSFYYFLDNYFIRIFEQHSIKLNNLRYTFKVIKGLPRRVNENIMIVGGSPTISDYLKDIRSFSGALWALNDAVFYLESNDVHVDALIVTDERFLEKATGRINKVKCKSIICFDGFSLDYFKGFSGVVYMVKSIGRDGFSEISPNIYHGCTVFYASIQMAAMLEYKKIVTCGIVFPVPGRYSRVDGSKSMPEYVFPYQVKNLISGLDCLNKKNILIDSFEQNSIIKYV
jgi:hypothetical protein